MSGGQEHVENWQSWSPMRRARAGLSAVVEPGSLALGALVTTEGAEEVWVSLLRSQRRSSWSIRARQWSLERTCALVAGRSMRFLVPGDQDWPPACEELQVVEHSGLGGAPLGLWVEGRTSVRQLLEGSVAIVGSRASTSYGERVASDLGADVGSAGHTVVSGGAYGIDACAHRGALAAQAPTAAILAGGLDQWYPRGNHALLAQVASSGAVLSEVAPGTRPTRAGFLARNRLLAALSTGTVLVEASYRSGALNTVAWAQRLGRVVMAVPGPVHSCGSVGPHQQLADHQAVLVTEAGDVLRAVGPTQPDAPRPPGQSRLLDEVPADLVAVREQLPGRGGLSVPELIVRTGLPVPEVLRALSELESRGLARLRPDQKWAIARP